MLADVVCLFSSVYVFKFNLCTLQFVEMYVKISRNI